MSTFKSYLKFVNEAEDAKELQAKAASDEGEKGDTIDAKDNGVTESENPAVDVVVAKAEEDSASDAGISIDDPKAELASDKAKADAAGISEEEDISIDEPASNAVVSKEVPAGESKPEVQPEGVESDEDDKDVEIDLELDEEDDSDVKTLEDDKPEDKKVDEEEDKEDEKDSEDKPDFLKKEDEDKEKSDDEDSDKPDFLKKEDEDKDAEEKKDDIEQAVEAIVRGKNFSESAKSTIRTIYRANLRSRVRKEHKRIKEAYEQKLRKIKKKAARKIAETVAPYLEYVAEGFVEKNQIAIDRGIRTEVTESFINEMKKVFEKHYVEVPKGKENMLEKLMGEVKSLNTKLNESMSSCAKLSKDNKKFRKDEAFAKACEGLTLTQVDKLKTLATGLSFENEESFLKECKVLKESHFPKKTISSTGKGLDLSVGMLKEQTISTDSAVDAVSRVLDSSSK